jgi:hypothetical protein
MLGCKDERATLPMIIKGGLRDSVWVNRAV